MRQVKLYVMDLREGDAFIGGRGGRTARRIFRIREMRSGVRQICTTGGGVEETRELNDTAMVWIEIP